MTERTFAGLAGTLCAVLALSACDRQEPPLTAGQKMDSAIETSKEKLLEAGQAASAALDAVGTRLGDSVITAEVKARLAADDDLRMLDISVETVEGRTSLAGSAPSGQARERAGRIAREVDGVTAVDNRLVVPQ